MHSTTGIEINENQYGVFNFESRKAILGDAAYSDVVRRLKSGVSRSGEEFKPFDISRKDTDSEKAKPESQYGRGIEQILGFHGNR